MERLTTNKKVSEMEMVELAHNCCYEDEEHNARYRDIAINEWNQRVGNTP